MAGVVIIGAGQAGMQAAASARDEGYEGPIHLIGEEPYAPYQRPPLSKAYLKGEMDAEGLELRGADFYTESGIALATGVRAEAIDGAARQVALSNGETLAYDRLVLATGAHNRPINVPGADLDGVMFLRGLADAIAIKAAVANARRAVVIGAGFIGLEFAAVAAGKGLDVTVVEIGPRVMGRSLSAPMSQFFANQHRAMGVTLRLDTGVAAIAGEAGRATGVVLTGGEEIPADLVLIGIGVLPDIALAERAGLATADGVVVDDHLISSDPHIFAIGDLSLHPNRFAPRPVRLESVQNAIDQGRAVGAALAGRPMVYDKVPWFWSDQGPFKLQMTGLLIDPDQAVVRGDPAGGAFSVFNFRQGALISVDSVNRPADHLGARRLLTQSIAITPAQAADEAFDLRRAV
jgi:3-phenylpropionate/trans-cinnamate dioxygenase ferredoxin reductase component